ncbi:hypothetical protein DPEC_G00182840 [Dallia pectoralis]|uniref:Uncharacterized protein n=1 Tax=Dallia pectoralis TaxID=75939 RepID=A0ACC2GAL4_DALPE|nr:hypothetical protein DPEC_G00182840 [Dallia pectoralis]
MHGGLDTGPRMCGGVSWTGAPNTGLSVDPRWPLSYGTQYDSVAAMTAVSSPVSIPALCYHGNGDLFPGRHPLCDNGTRSENEELLVHLRAANGVPILRERNGRRHASSKPVSLVNVGTTVET